MQNLCWGINYESTSRWSILHLGDFTYNVYVFLVTFAKKCRLYSVETSSLVKEYCSFKKVYETSTLFEALAWVQRFDRIIKYRHGQVKNIFPSTMFLKNFICSSHIFTSHLLFTEHFVRFYWGFREKHDSAAKKPTDCVINLFF